MEHEAPEEPSDVDPDDHLFAERRDEPAEDALDEVEARLRRIRQSGRAPSAYALASAPPKFR
jgi:hypothetical protein